MCSELRSIGGLNAGDTSLVSVPVTVHVVPTPPRNKRLLFDQAHSVRYPPSYAPRDNLAVTDEMLDWTGDHLHTK